MVQEEVPLGTAGAFKNAQSYVGDETFLAFNGDILTDLDLGRVLSFHREKRAEATIVLTPVDNPSAFGVVPTDLYGRVLGFIEKPPRDESPTNLINAGVYVFEPSILDRIPPGSVYSAERQLFPALVEEGAPLFAFATHAYWIDIGTPENYVRANLDALSGRYQTRAVPATPNGTVLSAVGASVSANGHRRDHMRRPRSPDRGIQHRTAFSASSRSNSWGRRENIQHDRWGGSAGGSRCGADGCSDRRWTDRPRAGVNSPGCSSAAGDSHSCHGTKGLHLVEWTRGASSGNRQE